MTVIRKATLEDVQALAPLFDAYRVFYEKASDVNAAATFKRQTGTQRSIHFCGRSRRCPGGFYLLYPLFSSTRMKRLWLLNDLYVQSEFRGQGHSIALIDAAKSLATATGAAGLMLETAKSNEIGNQLYPKTGFVCDDEHNYYSWDT
ncbi:MAG: GNAT family N-acetyltransferase [Saprospiraceae bacterium]|nr:GNAT family N-acetyltransferase [Saprospiraceae bacterium]